MLNRVTRITLASTAIAPLFLTYGWIAYHNGDKTTALILVTACAALACVCFGLLRSARKNLERTRFEATLIESANHIDPVFLLLYLLPLFMSQPDALDWRAWLPMVLIFTVFTAIGHNYHFNPLLRFMGWRSYKVGTKEGVTYTLITKRQIRNASEILCVGQLAEYIVIEFEGLPAKKAGSRSRLAISNVVYGRK